MIQGDHLRLCFLKILEYILDSGSISVCTGLSLRLYTELLMLRPLDGRPVDHTDDTELSELRKKSHHFEENTIFNTRPVSLN